MAEGDEASSARRWPLTRARLLGLAAGLVVIAVVVVVVVVASGGGSPKHKSGGTKAKDAATVAEDKESKVQAGRLRALLVAGTKVTYHATYTLTSSDPSAEGGTVGIEVWRQPPLERQDTKIVAPGNPTQNQEAFQLAGGLLTCIQATSGPWSCSSYSKAEASGADAIVQQITKSLADDYVTGTNGVVAAMSAKCYNVANKSSVLSICVSLQGIPLEVTDGTNTLVVTELDHTVAKSLFVPPAAVGSATTTTTTTPATTTTTTTTKP